MRGKGLVTIHISPSYDIFSKLGLNACFLSRWGSHIGVDPLIPIMESVTTLGVLLCRASFGVMSCVMGDTLSLTISCGL